MLAIKANEALNSRSLVNMIYVYPNQFYWKDPQVSGVLTDLFGGDEVILYPGQAGFVQQGQVFSSLLPPR
jgi:hypothetical protein